MGSRAYESDYAGQDLYYAVSCCITHGFLAQVVMPAVHLINRSPNPQEVWSGKSPSYAPLKVFGWEAFVHIRKGHIKLEPKSSKCIILRYGDVG